MHLPAIEESKPITTPHLPPYMLKVEENELVTLPHSSLYANVGYEQPQSPQVAPPGHDPQDGPQPTGITLAVSKLARMA